MRVRSLIACPAVAVTAACQDSTGPSTLPEVPPLHADPVQALLDAARAQAPIDTRRGVTINIPTAHLDERSADVLFYNDLVFERHRFVRTGATWSRVERLERGPFQPLGGSRAPGPLAYAGYSSPIATLYDQNNNVRDDDWLISNVVQTGVVMREEEYRTSLPYSGTFHEGTEEIGDTTFHVTYQGPWEAWHYTDPAGKNAQSSPWPVDVGTIVLPLVVDVSGTSSILENGWYTWNASAADGSPPYGYQWEYCAGSCGTVSTGTSYSRYVMLGDGDFTLKLTVSDSGTGAAFQQQVVWHGVYVSPGGGGTMSAPGDTIR